MITNITADKNYLTSIHDTKLRCWLSGDSFFQIQKPFDLQKIKIRNAYWKSNWIETSSTQRGRKNAQISQYKKIKKN